MIAYHVIKVLEEDMAMIEVVYRKENQDDDYRDSNFKLPKNIKQIGGGNCDIQVYMEDNVTLYLSKIPDREEDIRYGVLLGNVKRSCGYTYIFVNGAVDVREIFDNTVIFSDDIWTALNDDIYRYFQGEKVVGWFLSQPYSNSNQNIWIKKMHLNNFAGMDKVFFKIEREEEEEGFYYYGNDKMEKLPCYHIYYEKNPLMNQYMLDSGMDIHFKKTLGRESRGGIVMGAAEKKAEKIKNTIEEKEISPKEEEEKTESYSISKYSKILSRAASFFVIGALAVTIGVMGRQGKLDNLVGEFKSIINGIINDGDEPADGKGIISVNGVPSTTENKETSENTSQETTTQSEETTDDKDNETKEAATEPENVTSGEETTTLPEQQTASVTPAQTNTYMVEKGETLYSICMKLYGNTKNMDTIIELNGLESGDSIYYGKNLIVP